MPPEVRDVLEEGLVVREVDAEVVEKGHKLLPGKVAVGNGKEGDQLVLGFLDRKLPCLHELYFRRVEVLDCVT